MPKDDLVYIGHMLDMAQKVVSKVRGISRQTYDDDENLQFALVHLVQVIGEAARRVSTALPLRVAMCQPMWQRRRAVAARQGSGSLGANHNSAGRRGRGECG